jgi:phenylacetate-CoA ligase
LVTTAEGLLDGQRELLEAELATEVFDSYGAREVMNIGTECEKHVGFHLATDNLRIEVADDAGMPLPAGKPGRVLVTDFHNAASPLIRYEVGDIGVMGPDEPCACGRPFPRLARIEGRLHEVLHTPNGPMSQIWISLILRSFDWFDAYQVVQSRRDHVLFRFQTKRELTPELVDPLVARLKTRLGNMTIDCERVDSIARRPIGKFQLFISTVDRPS